MSDCNTGSDEWLIKHWYDKCESVNIYNNRDNAWSNLNWYNECMNCEN